VFVCEGLVGESIMTIRKFNGLDSKCIKSKWLIHLKWVPLAEFRASNGNSRVILC
jgi:hypothetical protein